MGITAKELAKKLNLSATAISMALNNKPGVSTKTRNIIIKEAEKSGYDFSKHSAKETKTQDIYFVIYRSHNAILKYTPIFSELFDGIEQECHKNGYHLKTLQIYEKNDNIKKYLEELRLSPCAGIILLGTEIIPSFCREFLSLKIPFVLLDTYFDSINCSSVTINNFQGAYLATRYLIDRTGKQPGHLRSSYQITNFAERRYGFERAVKENGMSIGKSVFHELSPSIEGAFSDMLEVIDGKTPLAECYFADNDLIAIGAIKALKLRGYKVPSDIAIAGFDNISESRIIDPALTTIDIPRYFMGQAAVTELIRQIKNPISHHCKIEISTNLIKRFSV